MLAQQMTPSISWCGAILMLPVTMAIYVLPGLWKAQSMHSESVLFPLPRPTTRRVPGMRDI